MVSLTLSENMQPPLHPPTHPPSVSVLCNNPIQIWFAAWFILNCGSTSSSTKLRHPAAGRRIHIFICPLMWQRTKDVVLLVENAAPCYVICDILSLPRAIDGGGQRATSGWLLDQTNQNIILHIDIYLHISKIVFLPYSIGLSANNLIFKISANKCWNIICGLLGPWSLEKEEIP